MRAWTDEYKVHKLPQGDIKAVCARTDEYKVHKLQGDRKTERAMRGLMNTRYLNCPKETERQSVRARIDEHKVLKLP